MEDEVDVILSLGDCECSKCHKFLLEGNGIMLKTCLHPFCRNCLVTTILESPDNKVMCPYPYENVDDDLDLDMASLFPNGGAMAVIRSACTSNGFITQKEIHAILSADDKQIYFGKSELRVPEEISSVRTSVKTTRPATKEAPASKTKKINHLDNEFEELNNSGYHIVLTEIDATCSYCTDDLPAGSGISLQICNHIFCRICLRDAIRATRIVKVNCPMHDCQGYLLDREIKQIASEEEFEQYLKKCLQAAEAQMSNIFHCKTKGCPGLCEVDENTRRVFLCPNCKQRNCLACKAIHEEVPCEKFREILAEGYTRTQATEIAKKELKSGWHQLFNYVNEPQANRSCPGTPNALTEHNSSTYHSIRKKLEKCNFMPSTKEFGCAICFDEIQPGEGIILQECLHPFCRGCIVNHITHSEDSDIKCPFMDGNDSCNSLIAPREIKALLPPNIHDQYLGRSIKLAEVITKNSFHCLTPDCPGWCEAEEAARFFWCPVCGRENCMRCKAFHEEMTCDQFKQKLEDDENKRIQLENERIGEAAVMASIQNQEFQRCPRCNSVCHKIDGCAHVTCAACKMPFNWR